MRLFDAEAGAWPEPLRPKFRPRSWIRSSTGFHFWWLGGRDPPSLFGHLACFAGDARRRKSNTTAVRKKNIAEQNDFTDGAGYGRWERNGS